MGDWSREELKQALLQLAQTGRQGADGQRPLERLSLFPVLLSIADIPLMRAIATGRTQEGAISLLLEHVAFDVVSAYRDRVKAFGDLLGLTQDIDMQSTFREFHGRGKPQEFARYGRGVRLIIAASRFKRGIEWAKRQEDRWAEFFVDELCTYLDNEDGKLTALARDLGLLPPVTATPDGIDPVRPADSASPPAITSKATTLESGSEIIPDPESNQSLPEGPSVSVLPEQVDPVDSGTMSQRVRNRKWRGWAVAGAILAALSITITFLQPQIRCKVGLERCPEPPISSTTITPIGPSSSSSSSSSSTSSPNPPTGAPIKISNPPKQQPPYQVPVVIEVAGVGDIPQGKHLWIFVLAQANSLYYPQDSLEPLGASSWVVQNVNVGIDDAASVGQRFVIYVLLADDETNAKIHDGLKVTTEAGYTTQEWKDTLQRFSVDETEVRRS